MSSQACTSSRIYSSVQLQFEAATEIERKHCRDQLTSLEAKVESHIELFNEDLRLVESRTQELQLYEPQDDMEDTQIAAAREEVNKRSQSIQNALVALGVIYSQASSVRANQYIGKVETSDNSQAFVGNLGLPQEVLQRVDQRIEQVTTTKGSTAMVGNFGGDVNVDSVFTKARNE